MKTFPSRRALLANLAEAADVIAPLCALLKTCNAADSDGSKLPASFAGSSSVYGAVRHALRAAIWDLFQIDMSASGTYWQPDGFDFQDELRDWLCLHLITRQPVKYSKATRKQMRRSVENQGPRGIDHVQAHRLAVLHMRAMRKNTGKGRGDSAKSAFEAGRFFIELPFQFRPLANV